MGQSQGLRPTHPAGQPTPPTQEAGIGSLETGTRWGPKMSRAGPTSCASLQGMTQPRGRTKGIPPPRGNDQTLPAQILLPQ